MGFFSRFERHMEDGVEGAANKVFNAPLSPVQISKKAERAMHREKMVGAGKQYAPTLYTVLVSPQDDTRLFGYYPTLAGETETYLSAKAAEEGFLMDGQPLVRFIVDEGLRRGKFDVVAELVSAPIIAQLRQEEMTRYGLGGGQRPSPYEAPQQAAAPQPRQQQAAAPAPAPAPVPAPAAEPAPAPAQQHAAYQPLPYVPENEIDRSIDYGEFTFNSQDWDDYQENGPSTSLDFATDSQPVSVPAVAEIEPEPAILEDEPFVPAVPAIPEIEAVEPIPAQPEIAPVYPEMAPVVPAQPVVPAVPSASTLVQTYAAPQPQADLSGLDMMDSYDEDPADPRGMAQDFAGQHAYYEAPDTAVFAAGAGQVNAISDQNAVRARLVDMATNQYVDLASNRLIMGRSSKSDIALDDINASRSHAELRYEPQGVWTITDLGSTNGTEVNGQFITTHALQEGDHIRIGTTDFAFTLK